MTTAQRRPSAVGLSLLTLGAVGLVFGLRGDTPVVPLLVAFGAALLAGGLVALLTPARLLPLPFLLVVLLVGMAVLRFGLDELRLGTAWMTGVVVGYCLGLRGAPERG